VEKVGKFALFFLPKTLLTVKIQIGNDYKAFQEKISQVVMSDNLLIPA